MVASTCLAKPTSPHYVVSKKYHLQTGHGEEAKEKKSCAKVRLDLASMFLPEFPFLA